MAKNDKKKKKLRFNPPPLTMPSDFQAEANNDDLTSYHGTNVATIQEDGCYEIDVSQIDMAPVFTSETSNWEDGAFRFAIRPDDMPDIIRTETDYRKSKDEHEVEPKKRSAEAERQWKLKCKLMRAYNDALASIKVGATYEQAHKMDTIDVSMATDKLASDNALMEQFLNYISSDDAFYACIPCFTTGILKLHHSLYIMWELKDIDVEQASYKVQTHVFSTHDEEPDTWWLNGIIGFKVEVTNFDNPDNPPTILISLNVKEICQTDQLTRALNLNAVGFNKQEQDFWKGTVRKFTDGFIRDLVDQYRFQFIDSAKAFLRSIMTANFFMSLTPARIPAENRNTKKRSTAHNKPKEMQAPERVLRIVDCMPIVSTSMPRCPTRKTVAQYRVASWQTRGHIRRYKSGKTVYVKPSVHHRKNMKNTDGTRPQQIIYIRDNTDPLADQNNSQT